MGTVVCCKCGHVCHLLTGVYYRCANGHLLVYRDGQTKMAAANAIREVDKARRIGR